MKKLFVITIILFQLICLIGCSNNKQTSKKSKDISSTSDYKTQPEDKEDNLTVKTTQATSESSVGLQSSSISTPSQITTNASIQSKTTVATLSSVPNSTYRGKFVKYTEYRKPLQNTYTSIKKNKRLNVAYLGGSVTAGSGSSTFANCWRMKTQNWFKTYYPLANINMLNVSVGNTGSDLGLYLINDYVIKQKADLLFIEYAINDNYVMSDPLSIIKESRVSMQIESIIRQVKSILPNCDIIMLLTIDKQTSSSYSGFYPAAQIHSKLAQMYNIPCINIGRALTDYISYKHSSWNSLYTDDVHPNDKGHQYYYDVIKEFLDNSLLKTKLNSEYLPSDKLPAISKNSALSGKCQMMLVSPSMAAGLSGWNYVERVQSHDSSKRTGIIKATISNQMTPFSYTFTGTELTLYTNMTTGGNNEFLYRVDGGAEKKGSFTGHSPSIIVSGLTFGKHTVSIKPVVCSSLRISEMEIYAVMTRNAT